VDATTAAHREWWTVFNDPRLTRLIELAYQQNLTLQTAGVRVLEARAPGHRDRRVLSAATAARRVAHL
jgi:outer membrane protein TolC